MTALWWIRRDLRLADNLTLQRALKEGPVLPVFILDPGLISGGAARREDFLLRNLQVFAADLRSRGSYLVLRKGKPVEVLENLMAETGAEVIFAEEDFTPYDRLRSVLVGSCLPLKLVQGQLGLHPLANLKANGTPYTVFTPFKKNWLSLFPQIEQQPAPEIIPTVPGIRSESYTEGREEPLFPAGEKAARERLASFLTGGIDHYHQARDRVDVEGTSRLSAYLHFGILGLRTALAEAARFLEKAQTPAAREGGESWLSELLWREFYIHILYHFPQVRTQNFRPQYDHISWRNNPREFAAWKEGLTGYPLVDAAMRQMKETGWMHNRARMITASFLVKDLLIDWRWGEAWFRECLLDGDLAANNGGWQWAAGTGTDAAPYFRIFNPILQSRKFDPRGDYIRKWVPELRSLDEKHVHAPWESGRQVAGYPAPIVDHKLARERALITYQAARLDRKR
jgi:deoxyribodipyrimidine photo-lyase